MRKLHWSMILVLVVTVVWAGVSVTAAEPIVIQMYGGFPFRLDGRVGPAEILDHYLREYERLHPNIKVENLGRNLDVDKLINLYITDQMPDIVEIDVKFLADFYRVGMLAPVPDWLEQRLRAEMFPTSVRFITLADRMIGIPGENMVTGLWYSRDALGQAGIGQLPSTVRELEELGRRLTRWNSDGTVERPGMIHSGGEWSLNHMALAMLSADGGRVYDDKGSLVIDGPALQGVLERLVTWMRPNSFFATEGFKREFDEGIVPFGVGYPWWVQGYDLYYPGDDYLDNFGVTLFPAGRTYGAFMYGHGYGVNINSPHMEEVWKLLEWLSLEVIDDITPIGHMMALQGSLPNRPQDIFSTAFIEARPIYEHFIENLDYARNTPDWERVNLAKAALSVALGETHPVQALEKAVHDAVEATKAHQEWLEQRQQ